MAVMAVKIKIMPLSLETDLKKLEAEISKTVESTGGKNCTFTEEPIAFGLKAIIAFFAWPEEIELEKLEASLGNLEGVNSIQIVDMRRAFGS